MKKVDLKEISQKQLAELLEEEENILILGNMGTGKSSIVRKYAKKRKKKLLIISLATMLPEFIGGIPYAKVSANKKTEYFTLLLNETLVPILESKGKGWIIFFDEINQAPTEVMNCLYSICQIDPTQREWCGHSLEFAQIVAAGNLSDGTDQTVYLNELPGPLLDRFFVFKLVSNNRDVTNYLAEEYSNIPHVKMFIREMLKEDINPRDIEKCLSILQFKKNPLLLCSKLGDALARKILDMEKGATKVNPTEMLQKAKESYKKLCENTADGKKTVIVIGDKKIATKEEFINAVNGIFSEEEIASIIKGGE